MMIHRRIKSPLVGANFFAKSIVLAIIGLSLATMPGKLVSSPAPNQTANTFDFFRVVENPTSEKSDHLQSVKINKRGRSFVIYTERKPSFRIPVSEIISITIERERIRGWKAEDRERSTGKATPKSKNDQDASTLESGFVYKATFSLTKSEKKRHDDFANANENQAFEFRFGDKRLGTVRFVGRFEGGSTFTSFLEATNVKEVFGSLKEKVIWK